MSRHWPDMKRTWSVGAFYFYLNQCFILSCDRFRDVLVYYNMYVLGVKCFNNATNRPEN